MVGFMAAMLEPPAPRDLRAANPLGLPLMLMTGNDAPAKDVRNQGAAASPVGIPSKLCIKADVRGNGPERSGSPVSAHVGRWTAAVVAVPDNPDETDETDARGNKDADKPVAPATPAADADASKLCISNERGMADERAAPAPAAAPTSPAPVGGRVGDGCESNRDAAALVGDRTSSMTAGDVATAVSSLSA